MKRSATLCRRLGLGVLLALTMPVCAQNEKVFFGILHSHTSYSDGSGLPEEAYAHARDNALCDFFALTEHNHNTGIKPKAPREGLPPIGGDPTLYNGPDQAGKPKSLIEAARAATQDGKFIALYGQEFSSISSGNHMNVFDVPDVIDAPNGSFNKLVEWVNQPAHFDTTGKPAILQFNHPSISLRKQRIEYGEDDFGGDAPWEAAIDALVRTIEIVNGPGTVPGDHHEVPSPAQEAFMYYLSKGFHVAPTADQDNHFKTWGTLTTARTGVVAAELTKPALLNAIRARHVYASTDQNMRVIGRVNGRLMGDIVLPPAVDSELEIKLSLADDDESAAGYRIEVYRGISGDMTAPKRIDVVSSDGNGDVSIEDIRYTGGKQYVFLKVIQSNEDGKNDEAWTAPIWFDPAATDGNPGPAATAAEAPGIVASRKSKVYHTNPNCPSARAIKAANLCTGEEAKQGREPHDCPDGH